MKTLLLIGLGGALGSMARYMTAEYVSNRIDAIFPYGTLVVNFLGCLLIGILFGLVARFEWFNPQLRMFLTIGFCGGYTTFSAFAYENIRLLNQGNYMLAFAYIFLSMGLCLAATFAGMAIVKLP